MSKSVNELAKELTFLGQDIANVSINLASAFYHEDILRYTKQLKALNKQVSIILKELTNE